MVEDRGGEFTDKALEDAIAQIRRKHGERAIVQLGGIEAKGGGVINTDSLTLDIAVGVGASPGAEPTHLVPRSVEFSQAP
jgi:RecA/RadA recombinase